MKSGGGGTCQDGEGHGAQGPRGRVQRSVEKASRPLDEPSWSFRLHGVGEYGGENQSLDRDRDPISPGALQIRTQTPGIPHNRHRCPGSFRNAGRNWCLGRDIEEGPRKENRPNRGKDLCKPQRLMARRHSDSHIQISQDPGPVSLLVVCVCQRVESPGLSFPCF